MKRSFIIPTLLILLLPVQIINADVQSQNSVLSNSVMKHMAA
jgi:hypothetical protein